MIAQEGVEKFKQEGYEIIIVDTRYVQVDASVGFGLVFNSGHFVLVSVI